MCCGEKKETWGRLLSVPLETDWVSSKMKSRTAAGQRVIEQLDTINVSSCRQMVCSHVSLKRDVSFKQTFQTLGGKKEIALYSVSKNGPGEKKTRLQSGQKRALEPTFRLETKQTNTKIKAKTSSKLWWAFQFANPHKFLNFADVFNRTSKLRLIRYECDLRRFVLFYTHPAAEFLQMNRHDNKNASITTTFEGWYSR